MSMSPNALAINENNLVRIVANCELEDSEVITYGEAREATEEQIGAMCAINAAKAEAYARPVFKTALLVGTYFGLSTLLPPPVLCAAAAEGAIAERVSENVTNSWLGGKLTWLTGKALNAAAACSTSAYRTAQVYKGNAEARPSMFAIGRAAHNYNPIAAAPAA
jgi:hypothetical protein